MKVQLDIGRLVLDGVVVAPHERPLLRAGVERELAVLIAERGVPSGLNASTHQRSRSAGPIRLAPAAGPKDLGACIASAVYAVLPGSPTGGSKTRDQ